jgi:hypothetical protein
MWPVLTKELPLLGDASYIDSLALLEQFYLSKTQVSRVQVGNPALALPLVTLFMLARVV